MEKAPAATGIQIAILIALHVFATSIVAYYLEPAIEWPREHSKALSNALAFGLALMIFMAVSPLRRYVAGELSRPIPFGYRVEVATVAIAHLAVPFAVMAATFLYFSAASPAGDMYSQLGLVKHPEEVTRRYFSTTGLFYAIVISILVGPIVEEIAFRGFLYTAWERQWGWFPAMLATSLCFALLHYGDKMPMTFVGSILYVCLLRRTGTLWAPICAHMAYNALVSWPLLGHVVKLKPSKNIDSPESWMLEFVCLAFAVVALPTYVWIARTKHAPANS